MTEWRAIPGYEGLYEVSDDGQVKSLPRFHVRTERILSTTSLSAGYPSVVLCRSKTDQVRVKIHALVMRAFVGLPALGQEVRHLNGDRLDPRLANLAYGSRSDNVRDAVGHGTHWKTAHTHCPQGHAFDEENTRVVTKDNGRTFRLCRACARAKGRAYKQMLRERRLAA